MAKINITIALRGDQETRNVWYKGVMLDPKKSQQIRNHSPDGFMWGYGGSGPAQLALSVCLEIFSKPHQAEQCYQSLKDALLSRLPMDNDFDIVTNLTFEYSAVHAYQSGTVKVNWISHQQGNIEDLDELDF